MCGGWRDFDSVSIRRLRGFISSLRSISSAASSVRHDITAETFKSQDGVAIRVDRGASVGGANSCDGVALACERHGSVGEAPRLVGKIMNRDVKNVLRSPDQSWDGDVHVSPSELLSLLSSFHARLDAFFEEIRVFPEAAARQKTADKRRSAVHCRVPLSLRCVAQGKTDRRGDL